MIFHWKENFIILFEKGKNMLLTIVYIGILFIFMCIDTYFYQKSPFPERTKNWYHMFPGGGIVTYFLLRKRNKKL